MPKDVVIPAQKLSYIQTIFVLIAFRPLPASTAQGAVPIVSYTSIALISESRWKMCWIEVGIAVGTYNGTANSHQN